MADATKIYLFWAGNTGDVPADWSYESGFDDKFIRGNSTYGGTGGVNTHTHTISSEVCNPTGDTGPGQMGVAVTIAADGHTHPLTGGACGNSTNLPPYRALIVISAAVATTTIPTGVIGIFESAPASGFSAYAAANSKYVRGGSAVGNGGASTHTHKYTAVIGNNNTSDNFESGLMSKAAHTHTHDPVDITSATGNWRPPGVKVLLHSSDSGQTMPAGLVAFFNGDPPAADWDIVSGAATNYYQRLLYADTSHGTTGASHGHSISSSSGIPSATANISEESPDIIWTGDAHIHPISATLNSSAPIPAYINVVFGKFKGVAPPPAPPANPLIGKPLINHDIIKKAIIR